MRGLRCCRSTIILVFALTIIGISIVAVMEGRDHKRLFEKILLFEPGKSHLMFSHGVAPDQNTFMTTDARNASMTGGVNTTDVCNASMTGGVNTTDVRNASMTGGVNRTDARNTSRIVKHRTVPDKNTSSPCGELTFRPCCWPLTALASFSGSGNTWTRHLMQQASGELTLKTRKYCCTNNGDQRAFSI